MLAFALASLTTAQAAIVYEADVAFLGDAGDLPSSAAILQGSGIVDTIFGHMHDDSRWTDMYGIKLSAGGTYAFVPSVVPVGTNDDFGRLNVFLFDSSERGIIGAKGTSAILNFVPTYSGIFYIAIIPNDGDPFALTDPVHNFQTKIFTVQQFPSTVLPGGPAASLPVYSWGGGFGASPNAYRIDLSGGVEFLPTSDSTIPEPATLALVALGLTTVGVARRRK